MMKTRVLLCYSSILSTIFIGSLCLRLSLASATQSLTSQQERSAVLSLDGATRYEITLGNPLLLQCPGHVMQWTHQRRQKAELIVTFNRLAREYSCAGSFAVGPFSCRNDIAIDWFYVGSIKLLSTRMDDAGIYTCVMAGEPPKVFTVTVLDAASFSFHVNTKNGTDPPFVATKRAVFPNNTLSFKCSVTFSGFIPPEMELALYNNRKEDQLVAATPVHGRNGFYLNEQAVALASRTPSSRYSSIAARCRARKINRELRSDEYRLIYGPLFGNKSEDETIFLSNAGNGVYLDCKADSFPPAIYEWEIVNADGALMVSWNGPLFLATVTGQYSCTARNQLNGVRKMKHFNVIDPPSLPTVPLQGKAGMKFPRNMVVTVVAPLILATATGMIVMGVCFYCCYQSMHNYRNLGSVHSPATQLFPVGVNDTAMHSMRVHVDVPPSYDQVVEAESSRPVGSSVVVPSDDRSRRGCSPANKDELPPPYAEVVHSVTSSL